MNEKVIAKLVSGRFIATIAVSITFVICSLMEILTPEQIQAVTMLVLSFYFSKAVTPTTPVTPVIDSPNKLQ